MKKELFSIVFATIAVFGGQVFAQQESLGERSLIFSCFYECKPGPVVQGTPTWKEVTTLMLANQSARTISYEILFLDGNENALALAKSDLSPFDLDEVYVCKTLEDARINGRIMRVPEAGLIEVLLDDPTGIGGAYGWIKNLLGKFFTTVDEPFAGRVTGLAKTECRLAPPSVITPAEFNAKKQEAGRDIGSPVIVEQTDDP